MTMSLAAAAAAAHVLVADVAVPELADADRHHLERVLRLRPGTTISLGDGRGMWRLAKLASGLADLEPIVTEAPQKRPVTVAFALTKGDKPDFAVQKLTELGVDHIVLFASARSVVKWDAHRLEGHLARLRRVADAAVCQCRRAWSPSLRYLPDFASVARLEGAAMLHVDGDAYDSDEHRALLVGPEGGWNSQEQAVQMPRVSLGPTILRAETASLAIASVACVERYYRT